MKLFFTVAILAFLAVDARPTQSATPKLLRERDTSVFTSGQGSAASAFDGQSTQASKNGSPPVELGQTSDSSTSQSGDQSQSGAQSVATSGNGTSAEASSEVDANDEDNDSLAQDGPVAVPIDSHNGSAPIKDPKLCNNSLNNLNDNKRKP